MDKEARRKVVSRGVGVRLHVHFEKQKQNRKTPDILGRLLRDFAAEDGASGENVQATM